MGHVWTILARIKIAYKKPNGISCKAKPVTTGAVLDRISPVASAALRYVLLLQGF